MNPRSSGNEVLVSPCQRVRVEFDHGVTWEPAVTVAAYLSPTGDAVWRARFTDDAPNEVVGGFLCLLAHDLAEPNPRDRDRALRGPAVRDAADCLPDLGWCPASGAGTFCTCRRTFGLEHTYRADGGWVLWGIADGERWRAHFDDNTPARLITAAGRHLAASAVCDRTTAEPTAPHTVPGETGPAPAGEPMEPSVRSRRSRGKGAPR
ncbi:DUF317 domain-containing protein [Kitasatospora indigofera]|uniref:DUF317 domain-containing protein n=1 Tax=Kitasatospora indigofera TaxID=67307 RepID=UPI00363085DA